MAASDEPGSAEWTYDDRFYPRAAESDMESEFSSVKSTDTNTSEEHTSVMMEDDVDLGEDLGGEEGVGMEMGGVRADEHVHPRTFHSQESEGGMEDYTCVICAQMLVDPLTLHCGHSFCQLCLARMWTTKNRTSPLNLQCPVCRQPWRNLPQINIQLRNIIGHRYSELVESRRSAMTEADHKMMQLFSGTRETERMTMPERPVHPEVRRVIQKMLFIFGIVITLLLVLFCLVLWAWAGAGGEFMRKPVTKWTSEDVAKWVEGLGDWAKHNYSQIFRKEHISGPYLLQLTNQDLTAIGIKSEYRRHIILRGIDELKLSEFSTPRNFDEFKAAHRKQTLLVATFYKNWPRLTFLYVYVFSYYDIFLPVVQYHFPSPLPLSSLELEDLLHKNAHRWTEAEQEVEEMDAEEEEKEGREKVEAESPKEIDSLSLRQLFAFAIEVILIPHLLVAWYAWSWFDLHPWICSAVIIHCAWASWREWSLVVQAIRTGNWFNVTWRDVLAVNWRAKIGDLLKSVIKRSISQYFSFAFIFIVATLLWHITPHFLCDILFYLILWHTVYMHIIIEYSLKFLRIRQERRRLRQLQIEIQIGRGGAL